MAVTDKKILTIRELYIDFPRKFDNMTFEEVYAYIDGLRQDVAELEFLYKCDVRFIRSFGSNMHLTVKREETDAEYNARMQKNERAKATKAKNAAAQAAKTKALADAKAKRLETQERALLEKLKAKYDV